MTRILDLTFGICALCLFLPLFLIIVFVLRFTGEGEVFFKQKRIGKDCETFYILKFATMLKDSPNIGSGTITSKNDTRILPVGRILRKTKLNELPQLFNIISGHMSLIGPRPLAPRDLNGVPKELKVQVYSHRPGLSGIGSLVFRGEERILQSFDNPRPLYDEVIAPYKAELELWYIKHKSLRLYLVLIFLTIFMVFVDKPAMLFNFFKSLPEPPMPIKELLFKSP